MSLEKYKSKTTMRYHFRPTRVDTIKREENSKLGDRVEKLEPSDTAGANVRWHQSCVERSGGSSRVKQNYHATPYFYS